MIRDDEYHRLLTELIACLLSVAVHDRPDIEPTPAELRHRAYGVEYRRHCRAARLNRGT